jgi:hypothetical protein
MQVTRDGCGLVLWLKEGVVCGVDVEVEKTEKFDGRCGQAVGSRCSLKNDA